jgi:glucose uptake protein
VLNYLSSPVGNPTMLFSGVGLVVAAILLNAYAYRRTSSSQRGVSTRGLVLSVAAGILMGFFYKYVANAMFSDFTVPEPGKLSPYTAVFLFATGVLLSNLVFNTILMKRPIDGKSVAFQEYFTGSTRDHLMGMLGGGIWCLGMSFNILASDKAGPAISYGLGQGATVIAAVWGIYIWKEFRQAPKGISLVLNGMLVCYLAGLALLIVAR